MARIRDIKPDFFLDEDLATLSPWARLLFVGLWTLADRAGRLEDRGQRIKAQVFPYDDVHVDTLLGELAKGDFLRRYEADGRRYIQIRSFTKHQHPHPKEPESVIPPAPPQSKPTAPLPAAAGNGEPGKAAAGNGEPGKSDLQSNLDFDAGASLPSGSSGSSGSSAPGSGSAPARDPSATGGTYRWCEYFGKRWCQQYNQISYGRGQGDTAASAKLSKLLESLTSEEEAAAWDDRERMLTDFLAFDDQRTRDARHPFSFFVERFNGLRVPALAARDGPPLSQPMKVFVPRIPKKASA